MTSKQTDFDALTSSAAAKLNQLAVIEASGPDAAAFLHQQLTNDVEHLDDQRAPLAGYCSPKGRLLATLRYWRTADRLRLLVSRDLSAPLIKRLSMFILRSRVKLLDITAETEIYSLIGPLPDRLAKQFTLPAVGAHSESAAGTLIQLPEAAGHARHLWLTSRTSGLLSDSPVTLVTPAIWDWLEVRAGEPRITAATQEQFVPQMVNLEVIGGVNFKKGCYPGQEVVARSQYRGTLKRRMVLASASEACPAAEVFHADDPEQPCGKIVNAAQGPDGYTDCLVEIRLAALQGGAVHVGAPNGPVLTFLTMPYLLPQAD